VKYEEAYFCEYRDGWHAEASLAAYFHPYDEERIHHAFGPCTPGDVYRDRCSGGSEREVPAHLSLHVESNVLAI
jgi:putative transposase